MDETTLIPGLAPTVVYIRREASVRGWASRRRWLLTVSGDAVSEAEELRGIVQSSALGGPETSRAFACAGRSGSVDGGG
jgi:hypothetical protein